MPFIKVLREDGNNETLIYEELNGCNESLANVGCGCFLHLLILHHLVRMVVKVTMHSGFITG